MKKKLFLILGLIIAVAFCMLCLSGCKPKLQGTWYSANGYYLKLNNDLSATIDTANFANDGEYKIVDDGMSVKFTNSEEDYSTKFVFKNDDSTDNMDALIGDDAYYFRSKEDMDKFNRKELDSNYALLKKTIGKYTWQQDVGLYSNGPTETLTYSGSKFKDVVKTSDGAIAMMASGTYKLSKSYDNYDICITYTVDKFVNNHELFSFDGTVDLSSMNFGPENPVKGKNKTNFVSIYKNDSGSSKYLLRFYWNTIYTTDRANTEFNSK